MTRGPVSWSPGGDLEDLPLPIFRHIGDGVVEVEGELPEAFYAEKSSLRALGRVGQYRSIGGVFVEFRFPSGRHIYRAEQLAQRVDHFRLDLVFSEPFDGHSAAVILGAGPVPGRDPR